LRFGELVNHQSLLFSGDEIMEDQINTHTLRIVQLEKLKELKAQEKNLKKLQGELKRINQKIKNKEELSLDDIAYLRELGWLAALAVTITSIAANI
jgi:TolA-binding protein